MISHGLITKPSVIEKSVISFTKFINAWILRIVVKLLLNFISVLQDHRK